MKEFLYICLIQSLMMVNGKPQPLEDSNILDALHQGMIESDPSVGEDSTSRRKIFGTTKKISDNIPEVSNNLGYMVTTSNPTLQYFVNPFNNIFFDYLERQNRYNQYDFRQYQKLKKDGNSELYPNIDIEKDDLPNYNIRKKVVYQQTILMPNNNFLSYMPIFSPDMTPRNTFENIPLLHKLAYNEKINLPENPNVKTLANSLEVNFPNPLSTSYQYSTFTQPIYRQIFEPLPISRQNWPLAQYFPIHIRDPLVQITNAITSMIEYGPGAGLNNPCPGRPNKKTDTDNNFLRKGKVSVNDGEIILDIKNTPEKNLTEDSKINRNSSYLNFEHAHNINGNNTVEFAINLKRNDKENKHVGNQYSLKPSISNNVSGTNSKLSDVKPNIYSKISSVKEPIISPPKRDPTKHTVEFGIEEEEKSDEIISNDGNKKLFSRDNTGSGVFIHRLKVRQGGVAIAGPGGIATAGSGGTAIVGSNGVAYTHPYSLAIAGSGSKVVAVDPTILKNLYSDDAQNASGKMDHLERLGKVVAVGPVIYYNKG